MITSEQFNAIAIAYGPVILSESKDYSKNEIGTSSHNGNMIYVRNIDFGPYSIQHTTKENKDGYILEIQCTLCMNNEFGTIETVVQLCIALNLLSNIKFVTTY